MILRGALLLHLDPPAVERADVRVQGGLITEVREHLSPNVNEQIVDLSGRWLMPGLVCAHHHLYSALACGMPLPAIPPTSFTQMLEQVWWKLDKALNPESIRVSALVGGLQALRAGVTTIIDHHASPNCIDGSLECLDESLELLGLRRVLCYEISDRDGPERAIAGLKAHEGLLGRRNAMRGVLIGGHANFTLSDATLKRIAGLAKEANVGTHLHVAEAVDDVKASSEGLITRMERTGVLRAGSILAHCVHLSADAIARIEDAGAWITHQPRSNMNNAVGYAPTGHFKANTALGTDGIGADLFAELQSAWWKSSEEARGFAPDHWLKALTQGAAIAQRSLGVPLGHIRAGEAADLVVLDPIPGPSLSAENLAAAWVFRFNASMVRSVMVNGSWSLVDREPTHITASEIDTRAQRAAARLWERM